MPAWRMNGRSRTKVRFRNLVHGEARRAAREHDRGDFQALAAVQERQREHERVPEDAVAEPARGHEEHANAGVLDAAIEPAAEPVFGIVESRQQ